jgi:ketosteroid isomerase-like protein
VPQENVELVRQLPPFVGDFDMAAAIRDADSVAKWVEALAPLFHEDLEMVFPGLLGGGETHVGIDGFVAAWSNWVSAWATYRVIPAEVIDCGDRVVVCYEVLAGPKGSTGQVKLNGADVFTVRDGRIARREAYGNRKKALKALGLEE